MDWLGRSIRRTATVSRPRNQSAGSSQTSSLEAYWCRRPQHALQTNGGLADLWCMDDGDITCHPILVRLSCRNLTSPTAQSRSGVELPENISHLLRERPWMQRLLSGGSAKCSTWPKSPQSPLEARSESLSDLDSTSRTNSFLGKADVIRSDASTLPAPPGPADGIRPPPKVSPLSSLAAPILQEQRAAEIYDEVGQRSLERLFPGLTEDCVTQATLSAGQSGIGLKKKSARHRCSCTSGRSYSRQAAHQSEQASTRAPPGDPPFRGHRSSHLHPTSAPLMTKIKPNCMFRRQLRQQTKLGSKQVEDCRDQTSFTRHPQLRLSR